jgi:putative ATP-dependent endonuclease of OLD family
LFEKVLATIKPFYEADGIYILSTGGIGFEAYFSILDKLKMSLR